MTIALNILAYNGERWLKACLESLLASLPKDGTVVQVNVIDNASRDRTPNVVQPFCPPVTYTKNRRNLGFAGGHNEGIRHALVQGAAWVGLLNQDLIFEKGWLDSLLLTAESNHRLGILSPYQYDYEGDRLDTGFANVVSSFIGKSPRMYYETVEVTGACLLIRSDVFRRIGLFDDSYFAYHEETDFLHRAAAAGIGIAVTPLSRVRHWHTLAKGSLPWRLRPMEMRNYFRCILKDPRISLGQAIMKAISEWTRLEKQAWQQKRFLRAGLLLNTALFDVPLRLPSILIRRQKNMNMIQNGRNDVETTPETNL